MGRNEGNEEKHWKGGKEEEEEHKQNERREGKKSSDLSRAIVEYYCSSN